MPSPIILRESTLIKILRESCDEINLLRLFTNEPLNAFGMKSN